MPKCDYQFVNKEYTYLPTLKDSIHTGSIRKLDEQLLDHCVIHNFRY